MKHIIWDFNGTLLGDAQLSVDVDNAVFDRLGLPRITLDTYRRHMTMPVCDFYAALGIDLVAYPYETISRLWLDLFNAGAVGCPGRWRLSGILTGSGIHSPSSRPLTRRPCGPSAMRWGSHRICAPLTAARMRAEEKRRILPASTWRALA